MDGCSVIITASILFLATTLCHRMPFQNQLRSVISFPAAIPTELHITVKLDASPSLPFTIGGRFSVSRETPGHLQRMSQCITPHPRKYGSPSYLDDHDEDIINQTMR